MEGRRPKLFNLAQGPERHTDPEVRAAFVRAMFDSPSCGFEARRHTRGFELSAQDRLQYNVMVYGAISPYSHAPACAAILHLGNAENSAAEVGEGTMDLLVVAELGEILHEVSDERRGQLLRNHGRAVRRLRSGIDLRPSAFCGLIYRVDPATGLIENRFDFFYPKALGLVPSAALLWDALPARLQKHD